MDAKGRLGFHRDSVARRRSALAVSAPGYPAQTAEIYCAEKLVAELPLDADDSYRWEEGDAYVSIEISAGGARVTDASCPDGDCIKRGIVRLSGESIVCLPNRISVVLSGANSLDAVVY